MTQIESLAVSFLGPEPPDGQHQTVLAFLINGGCMGQITNGKDGGLTNNQMEILTEAAITGDPRVLDDLIESLGGQIRSELARPGGPIAATIDELQREYLSYIDLAFTLAQAQALKTLQAVMNEEGDKQASAMVAAANSVLDRGDFPKRARQERLNLTIEKTDRLPSLADIAKAAGDDEDTKDFIDGFTDLLRRFGKLEDE